MSGPPPTPSSILKARGSWRAKKRQKEGEPALSVERPSCPAWLSKEAKAEWGRQVKHLERMGVLAKTDRAALAGYCQAWGEFVRACWVIENGEDDKGTNKGETTIGSTGNLVVSPWCKIRDRAFERMMAVASRFGFTPADRARLRADPAPAEDKDGGKGRFFQAG